MLSKYKENKGREFTTADFNCTTKTVFGSEYDPGKSFQSIFNRIDKWINEGSGWIIESIHLNMLIFLFAVHYQDTLNCLSNLKTQKVWLILKTMILNTFYGVILDISIHQK